MPKEPSWPDRVWQEFKAGNLTRAWRDVLLTLATFRGRGGIICPAHQTLGDRAKLSSKTAERALHAARALGLVTWTEQRVRRGWRWLRTTNLYRLIVPEAPLQNGKRPIVRTNRLSVGRGEIQESSSKRTPREAMIEVSPHERRAAQQGLAAIAARRAAALGLGKPLVAGRS